MFVRGALAAVLLLVLSPAPANAALSGSDVRWSVQPSTAKGPDGRDYIIRRAAPGERLTDYVGVTNLTARPLTFSVYGTDAYTTDDGSFALLPAAQKPTGIGSWMTLGAALVYLLVRFFVKRRRARAAALDTVPTPAA